VSAPVIFDADGLLRISHASYIEMMTVNYIGKTKEIRESGQYSEA